MPDMLSEDEVILRIITQEMQRLLDLEEQRIKATSKLLDALEAYREFCLRQVELPDAF